MKTTLTVSVALNVLLLGGAMFLWQHPRMVAVSSPTTPAMAVHEPQQVSPPVVRTVIAPFRWGQLLSTNNYLAFVASLRAAGCPEATVQDIVRGNMARAYAMMRERLGVSATEPGRWSEQAEIQMADYFLGQTPNAMEMMATARQNDQAMDNAQTGNAALATFLQNADLTTPGMTAEQSQEIANVRQAYLAQVNVVSSAQAQNSRANTSSASEPGDSAAQQSGADNLQTGTDASQSGIGDSQTAQSGTGDPRLQRSAATQALIQASQEQSILGGLFGMGAAMQ
jgi:hypothetical protein